MVIISNNIIVVIIMHTIINMNNHGNITYTIRNNNDNDHNKRAFGVRGVDHRQHDGCGHRSSEGPNQRPRWEKGTDLPESFRAFRV